MDNIETSFGDLDELLARQLENSEEAKKPSRDWEFDITEDLDPEGTEIIDELDRMYEHTQTRPGSVPSDRAEQNLEDLGKDLSDTDRSVVNLVHRINRISHQETVQKLELRLDGVEALLDDRFNTVDSELSELDSELSEKLEKQTEEILKLKKIIRTQTARLEEISELVSRLVSRLSPAQD